MLENFGYFEYMVIGMAAVGSAVIKNGVGVGAGIFMLPLLSLALPAKVALGLGAPVMVVSDVAGVIYYWGEWDKRELIRLLPPAVLGIVLGTTMIKVIPNEWFRFWVALFAILFASLQLFKLGRSKRITSSAWTSGQSSIRRVFPVFFGFLAGVASSVIHAGGLVMSPYLIQKLTDKRGFVGTFVLFFAIMNFLKLIAYLHIHILTCQSLLLAAIISPLIIVGGFCGNLLNKHVSQKAFRAIVLTVILIIGIDLLIEM